MICAWRMQLPNNSCDWRISGFCWPHVNSETHPCSKLNSLRAQLVISGCHFIEVQVVTWVPSSVLQCNINRHFVICWVGGIRTAKTHCHNKCSELTDFLTLAVTCLLSRPILLVCRTNLDTIRSVLKQFSRMRNYCMINQPPLVTMASMQRVLGSIHNYEGYAYKRNRTLFTIQWPERVEHLRPLAQNVS